MCESTSDPPLENRLSTEFINSLPIIRFKGPVIVIDDSTQAAEILKALSNEKILGFDTESRPSFSKGVSYPPAIIQLATKKRVYLFQLKGMGLNGDLIRFLADSTTRKIGIGLKDDIDRLRNLQPFKPGGFIDLSKLAGQKGIIQTGARALTARYLGHRLSKGAQTSNWAHPTLSEKQKRYAATDAWICLQIYPRLLADHNRYPPPEEGNTTD